MFQQYLHQFMTESPGCFCITKSIVSSTPCIPFYATDAGKQGQGASMFATKYGGFHLESASLYYLSRQLQYQIGVHSFKFKVIQWQYDTQ